MTTITLINGKRYHAFGHLFLQGVPYEVSAEQATALARETLVNARGVELPYFALGTAAAAKARRKATQPTGRGTVTRKDLAATA